MYHIHSCVQQIKPAWRAWLNKGSINSINSKAEQWFWGTVICYGWTVSAAVSQQEAEHCSLLHAGRQWRIRVCTGCLCVQARAHGISFSQGVYSPQTLFFQSVFLSNCVHIWLCVSVCGGAVLAGTVRWQTCEEEEEEDLWTSALPCCLFYNSLCLSFTNKHKFII